MNELFFELIRVALGNADRLSHIPKPNEWQKLYDMAKKQSLVGICFAGVQKTLSNSPLKGEGPSVIGIPEMLYLTWLGMAAKIQQRNEVMNGKTKEALEFFREKGFPCQVLKGQGIAALYRVGSNGSKGLNDSSGSSEQSSGSNSANLEQPKALNNLNGSQNIEPEERDLSLLRQSGDIDVWAAGGREKIYHLSREVLGKITGANYHHIHFPMWEDPEIELHIYPSFLSSPYRNWQLHKFCKLNEPKDDGQEFPSAAFNLVFIMLHCYRHLCGHGVGMRQVMDYYFVLRTLYEERKTKDENALLRKTKDAERKAVAHDSFVFRDSSLVKDDSLFWIERLGMSRFAPALMWVMKEVFGLEDEYLLCEPDEKEGKFLLNEIMNTGNMGHGETRFQWGQKSALGRFMAAQKRNLHLATHYPHEVLWSPIFNVWRFFWLKTKGL